MLRYWLFQAHWIVGITAGVILAFVGATGALLSFETEIVSWLNRDVRVLSNESAAILSTAELLERIAASNPERRVVSLTVFGDRDAQATSDVCGRGCAVQDLDRAAMRITWTPSMWASLRGTRQPR